MKVLIDQVFQKCLILAEGGDQLAIENIAYAYEKGHVVKQNFQKAYDWYSLYEGEWAYIKTQTSNLWLRFR